MPRVRVSATVDGDRLDALRRLTGARDSVLLDEALSALLARLTADRERAALQAQPYEDDQELAWSAPGGPPLPYDGAIPADVRALAQRRRRA